MHSVGASSVHSSYSDGLIRDMPVIADLNITGVSEIQDFKKNQNPINPTFQNINPNFENENSNDIHQIKTNQIYH